ncbi:MAG: N-acyl homoserine lactonase family protein [Oscillospiraceae bacterium]|nr:N-acyl homoserine lactonase family protein [Oscillospiraceae bacterium]
MPEIKIHLLRCGTISLSHDALFGGKTGLVSTLRGAAAPLTDRVPLPCYCYLIEHPKGLILVDAGVGRAFSPSGVFDAKASASLIGAPLTAYLHPSVENGMSISEQLSRRGLKSEDLDLVLLTHLDADHVGGLHELRGAKRFLLSEDEYYWSCRAVYKLRQPCALWMDMPIERFWYRGSPLGTNRWAYDLFDDESVMLINLPGHTDGLCAVMVRNGGRFALLASDAALCRENLETRTPPGFYFDRELGKKALAYLCSLHAESGCEAILLSHDRHETRETISL